MTPFKDNITKSIDNLNKLQEDVDNTIADLQEQIEEMEDLETKNVTITTNTETTIEPTTGKYALEKVVVTTNVEPVLEEKSVTITENKETTITPSENYQGLSRVVVTTNIQSGLQDITDCDSLFYKGRRLNNLSDLSPYLKPTTAYEMFSSISASTFPSVTIPLFDVSNCTNCGNMFTSDTQITSLPNFNFASIQNARQMFQSCSGLTDITNITFGNTLYSPYSMFSDCTNLVEIPILNFSNVTGSNTDYKRVYYTYNGCTNLSNTSLQNILKSLLTLPSNYSYTKTLQAIGLTNTQATTCTGFDDWATLSADGWTTGY